jgi:hypothetical protein
MYNVICNSGKTCRYNTCMHRKSHKETQGCNAEGLFCDSRCIKVIKNIARKPWSEEERVFLFEYAGFLTREELSKALDRSIHAVECAASKGLRVPLKLVKEPK